MSEMITKNHALVAEFGDSLDRLLDLLFMVSLSMMNRRKAMLSWLLNLKETAITISRLYTSFHCHSSLSVKMSFVFFSLDAPVP